MSQARTTGQGADAAALAWLESATGARAIEQIIQPLLDAAAVLATFCLAEIEPAGPVSGMDLLDAKLELTGRCRLLDAREDSWQLEENARRAALGRLGTRTAMQKARHANAGDGSALQAGIDRLIDSGSISNLDELSLDELLGIERALGWFEGLVQPLPARAQLTARIERERQLAPMRKIAGSGFVDREAPIAQLTDYVGALPPDSAWSVARRGINYVKYRLETRPPLHLHAPGGMGKSALLAHFILRHADPKCPQPLPFVYLDFDRASLDPRDPQTLLGDAIRQLLVQFPWVDPELRALDSQASEQASQLESVDIAKSAQFDGYKHLVRRFARLLAAC